LWPSLGAGSASRTDHPALHVAPRAERVACFSSSRLLAPREYCWNGVTKKSYDSVVGKYASPVFALVDSLANIFFRIMPMHRNPVAYLLRVAAAPKGLNFGKVGDSITRALQRIIRHVTILKVYTCRNWSHAASSWALIFGEAWVQSNSGPGGPYCVMCQVQREMGSMYPQSP
jgi:hypothetical protein